MYNITKRGLVEQSLTSPFSAALKYNSEHTYHNLYPRRRVGNQTPSTSPTPLKTPVIPLTRLDAAQQHLEIRASKQPTACTSQTLPHSHTLSPLQVFTCLPPCHILTQIHTVLHHPCLQVFIKPKSSTVACVPQP